MKIAYLLIFLLFISNEISGQVIENIDVVIQNDTTFFYQQVFQDDIDSRTMDEGFRIEQEYRNPPLLNTPQNLLDFFKFLISIDYPGCNISELYISEDKTKDIWFAYANVGCKYRELQLIVCKGTCKVLFFRYAK